MKIALAGLISDNNLGDKVIFDNTKYLYKYVYDATAKELLKESNHLDFFSIDLLGSQKTKTKLGLLFYKIKRKIFNCFSNRQKAIATIINNKIRYYKKIITSDIDAIILVGGGLIKYKYQNEILYNICALISVSYDMHIPLILNAVGVEGFDESDIRCVFWKHYLNFPNIIAITTRDDINLLINKILISKETPFRQLVSDPAVWSSITYNIGKEKDTDLIGIGIIRGNIFRDNNIEFSREKLVDLYSNIAKQLIAMNFKICFFTNGLEEDAEIYDSICDRIKNHTLPLLTPVSNDGYSLVRLISQFKFVIAARLHANIIAYSLGIQSLGIAWNDKLLMWAKNINREDRFFDIEHLTEQFSCEIISNQIVTKTLDVINQDAKSTPEYDMCFKQSIVKSIEKIFKLIYAYKKG